MQGPTGVMGVQVRRNRAHWGGVLMPVRISPQAHSLGSAAGVTSILKRCRASNAVNSSLTARPLSGMTPIPRQRASQGSNTLAIISLAVGLPWSVTALG